ncbi:SRPBCC domain-containing protein [Christiangramia sp. OXR-203]|jgi:uncharacterized protein YndB with AHSA1/START domain|uniref:SRPBCC domain-containing protein n=1 Tax=Christiangramia sp. OXR-203 TaxID=3100176 RepID=UPI002AC8F2B6|nr:SRPBCC domain-containing protein [Christiangramia sp. OXR-203]WPY98437.1 SRPBCC domain-containing protein [Christiangramia sp. OXR-203]
MKNPEKLRISTKIQVAKSREDVFQTITDRKKLNKFFISEASSDLEAGKRTTWKFPEFKFVEFSVDVLKVEYPEIIVLTWEGAENHITTVTFELTEIEKNQTLVSIVEEGMQNDDEGIAWLGRNSEGWANFLACLKAYLEYGINLREGAFEFLRNDQKS